MSKNLLLLFCALHFAACDDPGSDIGDKAETIAAVDSDLPFAETQRTAQPTFNSHWGNLKKTFVGLDSAEALAFCSNQPELKIDIMAIDSGYALDFVKQDLGGNSEAEMAIWLQRDEYFARVAIYQLNANKDWCFLWDGYGDDVGNEPKIEINGWISCPFYNICSNCSMSGDTYYEVRQDTVIELMTVSGGYNVEHDITDYEAFIYEECNGYDEVVDQALHVTYHLQFSETESELIFLEDNSIKVIYTWNDVSGKMEMTSVSPKALKPFIEKWNKKGQKEYAEYGYHPNNEVLPAYMEYKKDFLINLQHQSKYNAVIKKLSAQYECSWTELMTDWPERYSWGGFQE